MYMTAVVQSLSCVRLFCDPMDCSPPGSCVHGISQARILEWVAMYIFFFIFFSILVYHKVLNIVPCAIQQDLVVYPFYIHLGFPGGSDGKEPTSLCRRHKGLRFNPWVRKILWSRKWQPTLVSLPGESPWAEEPGGLQSIVSQSVGHD